MVDQNLLNYIWSYLQQGYDPQAIRDSLLKQGYDAESVKAAFDTIYASSYHEDMKTGRQSGKTPAHFSVTPTEIVAAVLILVGASILGILFFALSGNDEEAIDAHDVLPSPQPDTALDDSEPIEEPRDSNTTDSSKDIFDDGSDEPTRDSSMDESPAYDNEDVSGSLPEVSIPEQRTLSRLEIEQNIKQLAVEDPLQAVSFCPQIITRNGEFSCYSTVALLSKQPKFCQYITDEKQSDFCYMQFAIEGIGTDAICSRIQDVYRKESCLQLIALYADYKDTRQRADEAGIIERDSIEDAFTDSRFADSGTDTNQTLESPTKSDVPSAPSDQAPSV
ncbi:MAG: hypothetical protein ACOCWQ_05770 [Nanoarchaeota archaeon]